MVSLVRNHLTVMNIHMDDRDQYLNGRRVICERCMAKEGDERFSR